MKKLEIDFTAFHEAVVMKVISCGNKEDYCNGMFIEPNNNMCSLLSENFMLITQSDDISKKFAIKVFDSEEEAREAVIKYRQAVNEYNKYN